MSSENQQPEKRSKLLTVCPYILGNELCERLAYYGMQANLVNYFKRLGASSSSSASAVSAFTGFCYLFPLIGGWIADSFLGRYRTIFVFSTAYIIGMMLLTGSAAIPGIKVDDGDDANVAQWLLLAFSLFIISAGTGGIKPNVSSFGADQFDDNDEQDRKEKKSFFNWFYCFINIGSLFASLIVVKIQDEGHWDIGFAIPAIAMLVALLLFLFGTSLYKFLPVMGAPLERFIAVTRCALSNRRKARKNSGNFVKKQHWLDWAIGEEHYTAAQVYEIKLVYRPWQVFLTLVFYWLIYVQMSGTFVLQAEQMDRKVLLLGFYDYKVPSASMTLFNTGAIIVFVPIYDLLVIPSLKKCLNYSPTDLQRLGTGYIVAIAAILSAALIEWQRLRIADDGKFRIEMDDDEEIEVVKMSIWWQIIPYLLVGLSEVLSSIASIEFFYSQAPDSMRSMMSALSLLTTSVGGYLSSLLLYLVDVFSTKGGSKWIPDNLNEGHLDYFFLLITGLMALNLLWFVFIAVRYEYKEVHHQTHDHETEPMLDPTTGKAHVLHEDHPDNEDTSIPLLT